MTPNFPTILALKDYSLIETIIMEPSLHVTDSRTGISHTVPIHTGNYIRAADLGKIKAPERSSDIEEPTAEVSRSLRILDNGFQHTACMESSVTLV